MKILESYIILKSGKEGKTLTANYKTSHLRKNAANARKIRFDNLTASKIDSSISADQKRYNREARNELQRIKRAKKRAQR